MIFYFSGTGNSYQVAKKAAKLTGDTLVPISKAVFGNGGKEGVKPDASYTYCLKDGESIGFIFPVHAWAPPPVVQSFIENLNLENYKGNYTYSIVTCGDNIGDTMKVLRMCLKKKSMELDSGFSVQMPNTYILLFNVDSKELENKKLSSVEGILSNICAIVQKREKGVFRLHRGWFDVLMTKTVSPLFKKHPLDTKGFWVEESCTACGLCEKICNSRTIKVDGRPRWGNTCTQCLACIHVCPVHAIQYGKRTIKKGRYINPEKLKDLNKA